MFIIDKVISTIVAQAAKRGWKTATQKEKVLKVLDKVGLKPGAPESDFDSVYAHTLVYYGVDKPEPILEFFRHDDIQRAFRESFEKNNRRILHLEAQSFLDWHRIGDELREKELDPQDEFARFTLVFNEMVDHTRTAFETRAEQKLNEILQAIKGSDLEAIRAKNLEKIQGSLADQLKTWFKTLGYKFGSHTASLAFAFPGRCPKPLDTCTLGGHLRFYRNGGSERPPKRSRRPESDCL